jgi:hypothetical protein
VPALKKRVLLLGSTGSIGTSALKVARALPDRKKPAAPAAQPPAPAQAAPAPAAAPGTDSIAAHSRLLVGTIIGTFTERLKSEVARRGGRLYTEDIDRIAEELDGKRAQLEAVFRKTFETYVQARERAAFDHAREFPFDRLIVNTFAELFAAKRAEADGEDAVGADLGLEGRAGRVVGVVDQHFVRVGGHRGAPPGDVEAITGAKHESMIRHANHNNSSP